MQYTGSSDLTVAYAIQCDTAATSPNKDNGVTINKSGGTGTITFSSASNTYQGPTTLTAGTLSISSDANLGTVPSAPTAGNIAISEGILKTTATFALSTNRGIALNGTNGGIAPDTSTNLTYAGTIAGSGNLTKSGAGLFLLNTASTHTGRTMMTAGTFRAGAINILSTSLSVTIGSAATFDMNSFAQTIPSLGNISGAGGNITMGNATLTINQTATSSFSGVISGSGALIKNGNQTLSLLGTNTYTGATTIGGDTLVINSDASLGTAPASPTAGQLVFNTGNTILETTATFTLNSNRGIALTGNGTILTDTGTTLTYSGIMAGAGTFTKDGVGTLILGGANTYTAATTIANGILSISADNNLGAVPGVTTPGQITFTGGTLQTTAGFTLNPKRGIALTTTGTISPTTGTLVYTGNIAGSGTLTKSGAGIFQVNNLSTSTYTGATFITAGIFQLTGAGSSTSSSWTLSNVAGAAFDVNGNSATINNLSGGGTTGGNITLGNNGLLTINQTIDGTFAGVISETALSSFIKSGAATLTLSGINTYTGPTSINAGTLAISADANLGTAPGSPTAGQLIFNGGTLETTATFTLNSNRGISLTGTNTISTDTNTTLTYGGIMTGAGALIKAGAGTLVLSGVNTNTGGISINAGAISISNDNNLGNTSSGLTFNGGTLIITGATTNLTARTSTFTGNGTFQIDATSTSYSGVISGSGTLTKTGTGTLILGGNNNNTGPILISAGTLSATNANALGTTAGGVTVSSGATLDINGVAIGNEPIIISGTGASGVGALTGTGTASLSGTISLTADTSIGGAGTLTLSGVISDTATSALTKIGAGTLILSNGANTYHGATTVSAGTLSVNADGNFGTAPSSATANSIVLNGSTLLAAGSFTLNANRGMTLSSSSTINVNPGLTLTYNGIIAGSGGLTKTGTGTLSLGGNNTYSGATNISAGTLAITAGTFSPAAGSTNTGTLSMSSGTTLNLTSAFGSTSGSVTSAGTVNLDSNTLTASTYTNSSVENHTITSDTAFGAVSASGAVNLAGATVNVSSSFIGNPGQQYQLTIVSGSSLTAPAKINLPPTSLQTQWSSTTTTTSIIVNTHSEGPVSPGINTDIYNVLNAMFGNIKNSAQQQLINAFLASGAGFDDALHHMIPMTNILEVDWHIQNAYFNKVEGRIAALRNNADYYVAGSVYDSGCSIWTSGLINLANQGPSGSDAGYNAVTGGIMIGADAVGCDGDVLGVAAGYTNTAVKEYSNAAFTNNIDSFYVMGYSTINWNCDDYIDLLASATFNRNNAARAIFISGTNFSTKANYNSNSLAFRGVRGRSIEFLDSFLITPLVSMQYAYLDQPAYKETGSAAALKLQSRVKNIFTLGTGFKFAFPTNAWHCIGMRELRASVSYDVINNKDITTANFVAGSNSFSVVSTPARLALQLGASITVRVWEHVDFLLNYDFEIRDGFNDNSGIFKVRYLF